MLTQINRYSHGITAHMMVKNEERWVWFAITSVIDFMDKIIIFDTGSTDNTVQIIKTIAEDPKYKYKIIFEEKGDCNPKRFSELRQMQLDMTETEWMTWLDGDEIWYKEAMNEMAKVIKEDKYPVIAVKFINCVGDIYHQKSFESMHYRIKNIQGSIQLRGIKVSTFPGCKICGDYGFEGLYNKELKPIGSVEDNDKIVVLNTPYLHTSFLQRSSSLLKDWQIPYRRSKVFAKWDLKAKTDFKFPEAFYLEYPSIIKNPFKKMGIVYYLLFILNHMINTFGKKPIYLIKKIISPKTFKTDD